MSGKIIHALPLTVYDIGTNLPHGNTVTLSAGRVIDVSEYPEAALVVRLHRFFSNTTPNTPSWQVQALLSGFTAEDEKAPFNGAVVADTNAQTGSTAPALIVKPFNVPFGSQVLVQVILSQANSSATVSVIALSVDVVAKC